VAELIHTLYEWLKHDNMMRILDLK